METINKKSRPCISCDREIKSAVPEMEFDSPERDMWESGIVTKVTAGYGSNHDTNIYVIALCDDCITFLEEEKKIYVIGQTM